MLPVIVVAVRESEPATEAEPSVRDELVDALGRRYDRDYELMGVDLEQLPGLLDDLSRAERQVAVVVAGSTASTGDDGVDDADLDGNDDAVQALARVRGTWSTTRRILLVPRGQWRAHPVREAMVLGHVDGYLFVPWAQPERWLYQPMTEYLAGWEKSQPWTRTAFTVVGRPHDRRSHALRDVLSRAEIPYLFLDADSETAMAALVKVGADGSGLPVLIQYTGQHLIDPTDRELVDLIGFRSAPQHSECDVAIVGAGPAGLSAAVYAASEGLSTVVIDPTVPGGQAGTSSMIRNYLGFPRGLSGSELTNRAVEQAWLFGAEFILAESVVSLEPRASVASADLEQRRGDLGQIGRHRLRSPLAPAGRAVSGGASRDGCLLRRGRL